MSFTVFLLQELITCDSFDNSLIRAANKRQRKVFMKHGEDWQPEGENTALNKGDENFVIILEYLHTHLMFFSIKERKTQKEGTPLKKISNTKA